MRAFRSPSGRDWTADVFPPGSTAGASVGGSALRFRSGDLVQDLRHYPPEWQQLPDGSLIELLRQAQPPGLGLPGPTAQPSPDEGASA